MYQPPNKCIAFNLFENVHHAQENHYENKPIQINWKSENFTTKKGNFTDKSSGIFQIPAQNIDCGYSLEPRRRGGSNKYSKSMFFLAK